MWYTPSLIEFRSVIETMMHDPDILAMSHVRQHVQGVTRLDHSMSVAYLSFCLCRKLRLNACAAARAGLLHDLDSCHWRDSGNISVWQHIRQHPKTCMENAKAHGLSALEQDIILKHMWPLTLTKLPRHRESFVVNFADKLCYAAEISRLCRFIRAYRWLEEMVFEFMSLIPAPAAI